VRDRMTAVTEELGWDILITEVEETKKGFLFKVEIEIPVEVIRK